MATQGFSAFSADAVTYIAEKTLSIAKKSVVFQQFGDKAVLPANNSKTFQYTRFDRLALPKSTLTDGTTPDNTEMSISTVTATCDQWGAYVAISDVAELTIKHPVMQKAINLMGYQAAETVDREIIVVLLAGTSVSFPTGVSVRSGLSSTSTDVVSTELVRKVVANIRSRGAHEFDGNDYVGVVDPYVEMDISKDSTFQAAGQYSNIKVLQNGEIGRWMGVRWMRSNHIPTLTGAASVAAASATGGSLASANYFYAVEYIDNNTGFAVQASQAASVAVGASGRLTLTTPTSTSYKYNVYIGTSATVLYKALSLEDAASAVSISATSSSGLLGSIPASGKIVHFSWVFGKEAFTVVDLQKLQTFLTPNQASDSDPLAQRRKAGWKLMFKAVINNENFLERMETLSAYG